MQKRRRFVTAALAAGLAALLPAGAAEAAPRQRKSSAAKPPPAKKKLPSAPPPRALPPPDDSEPRELAVPWHNYELVTSLSLPAGKAPLRLWLPLPLAVDTGWQRCSGQVWTGNADRAGLYRDPDGDLHVFFAEWLEPTKAPQLQLTSTVATRDRQFDITRRQAGRDEAESLRRYLRSTPRLPTDGLVRSTAEHIIGRIKDPVAQGKALYDWVAERTRFDTRGSGNGDGDIPALISRPETPARCADINGLFVALARAIGLPARLSFGLRIDQSLIVASLGQRGELADAQHCRAEFYAPGYGWIPVDPADVRKALAEDSSTLDGMKGTVLRKLLFGYWEPNWIAYNRAQDVSLRHAAGPSLAAFAAPCIEIAGQRVGADGGLKVSVQARRGQDTTA